MADCRVCHLPIEREPGKKGRPNLTHPECRPAAKAHQRISPGVSSEASGHGERKGVAAPSQATSFPPPTPIPDTKRIVVSAHEFALDPHPAAWRWCRVCGRSRDAHIPQGSSAVQAAAKKAAEWHETQAFKARLVAGDQ